MERDASRLCLKGSGCQSPKGQPLEQCPIPGRLSNEYIDRSSLVLPEHVCLRALLNYPETRTRDPYKGLVKGISRDLDTALALPQNHLDLKEQLIKHINLSLQEAEDETDIYSDARLPYFLRSQHFKLIMPLFAQRIRGNPINQDIIDDVQTNICRWLETFDEHFLHTDMPQNRRDRRYLQDRKNAISARSELEISGLYLHGGLLSFPTTIRQEASQGRINHNHDIHVLRMHKNRPVLHQNGPVQIKESSNGNGYRGVISINHQAILHAIRKVPGAPPIVSEPNAISQLLAKEYLDGYEFDPFERNILSLASAHVVSRYTDFLRSTDT